ncbi:MAG: ABC transporter substrate-binding protein [Desulfobaccales bacterium]
MALWRRGAQLLALGVGLFLLLILCGCQNPFQQPPLVGIILWNQDIQSFDDNLQGVVEGLREEGYLEGLNLRLQIINATGDRTRAAKAAEEFQEHQGKLLITLGTLPTLVALNATQGGHIPIVYSGVGAPASLDCQSDTQTRLTGTSMEVPVTEQLRMLRLAQPRVRRLGIVLCTASPEAIATGASADRAAQQQGLKTVMATVTDERPQLLENALNHLLEERIDALFLPIDPVLAAPRNLQIICERMLQARVPLMVPFESSVTLGALISYHADFAEVGRQAGRQAGRILSGAALENIPPEIPKVKRLTLNLRVAHALKLPLSRRLLSRAHDLY